MRTCVGVCVSVCVWVGPQVSCVALAACAHVCLVQPGDVCGTPCRAPPLGPSSLAHLKPLAKPPTPAPADEAIYAKLVVKKPGLEMNVQMSELDLT